MDAPVDGGAGGTPAPDRGDTPGQSADARPAGWVRLRLEDTPRLALWLLVVVLVVKFALAAVFNYAVFSTPLYRTPVFGPIARATGGLVTSQLLVGLFQLAVLVGGLVWLVGGLHPANVGLRREDLREGVVVTAALWTAVHVAGLAVAAADGSLTPSPLWQAIGTRGMASNLLAEVVGTAPMEEAVYRGLFLTQGYLLAQRVIDDRRASLLVALVASQAVFALAHVPARLVVGTQLGLPLPQDLLVTFALGAVFALTYLRTGNLFVAMGVHVLSNDPTSLLLAQPTARLVVAVCLAAVLVAWPRLQRLPSVTAGRTGG